MSKNKKTFNNNEQLTAEEVTNNYTVAELRTILKENGLSTSGKKADLVEKVLPILNDDSGEDAVNDVELTENAEEEKVVSAQTDDSSSEDEVNLAYLVNDDSLSSTLSLFGVNYEDLAIKDKIVMGEDANLNIQGFTQDGISMSDSTMSIVSAADSSYVNLKMNIPEVSFSNYEDVVFTFKNLDLCIFPSSNPQTLEFSAIMDSLELVTDKNYIHLKDLNLFFKSFPDGEGIRLDIDIGNFLYPNYNNASFNFDDLDFNMSIGIDGKSLDISINLPKLHILDKNYMINLSDLNLNIALPDTKLSNLDLSIAMADFNYTNFDDVNIAMEKVNVSLDPILNSNSFDVLIGMNGLDASGLTFDEMFPMLNITNISFKNTTDDTQLPINLMGLISPLDVYNMDLLTIGALLSSGFDLDTYMKNMPDRFSYSEAGDVGDFSLDLGSIFENFDYSSLDSIVLDLTGLLDSTGIDLDQFGIDLSDYDLSEINLADLIGGVLNSGFDMSNITSLLDMFSIDWNNLDMSGLIVGFDSDKFDISSLLSSLNLSNEDISSILEILNNPDLDLGSMFENFDNSIFDGIVLDLSGLIDSLGIDLAEFGIDLSELDVDLSAIKLSDLIDLISNFDFDMSTIMAMLNLSDVDWDNLDMSGLVSSFDFENFDMSSLISSINISGVDISAILEMFNNSDIDFEKIFENCDYSCLDSIELNLTELLDSLDIDLAKLGIDLSELDVDLSAIKLSELIDLVSNFDFDMSTIMAMLKLSDVDWDNLDMSGLVSSFDFENFDMSSLIGSLDLSKLDIPAITEMFENSDIDFEKIFENCDYSSLDSIVLDLSGLIDSAGIDLAELGIDLSDYDLSAIKLSDLIDVLSNSEFDMAEFDLSAIDWDNLDASGLISSFDADNFDMSGLVSGIDLSNEDISGILEIFNNPDLDLAGIFENCDYSCLSDIELDLSGLIDSLGIDLAELGIDLSDYDLSAIKFSDLIDVLSNNEFDMSTIMAMLNLSDIDLDNLDMSGLISSFDFENFDMSTLLSSINISGMDISSILGILNNIDWDVSGIFENCDYSCFSGIELDLTGVLDSLGIDLAKFGIDLSDYDLSAISLSDLIDIVSNFDFDMSTIMAMLNLSDVDWDNLDMSGLISSFDFENFDMSSLISSINISGVDISGMVDMFSNMDIDFEKIFENFDYSCLGGIMLNLTGLIDSAGINLDELGIDLSDYDLSAINLSDLIDVVSDSEIYKSIAPMVKLFGINWEDVDMDGLIVDYDLDNLDVEALLTSLNIPGMDIEGILAMFDMYGFDLTQFLNNLLGSFMGNTAPEVTE